MHLSLSMASCIVGLPQVDEDTIQWDLVQVGQLLSQLDLRRRCPRASTAKKSIQAVMELDVRYALVHQDLDDLPERFQKTYAAEVSTTFGK